jgi:hypothetical protein
MVSVTSSATGAAAAAAAAGLAVAVVRAVVAEVVAVAEVPLHMRRLVVHMGRASAAVAL